MLQTFQCRGKEVRMAYLFKDNSWRFNISRVYTWLNPQLGDLKSFHHSSSLHRSWYATHSSYQPILIYAIKNWLCRWYAPLVLCSVIGSCIGRSCAIAWVASIWLAYWRARCSFVGWAYTIFVFDLRNFNLHCFYIAGRRSSLFVLAFILDILTSFWHRFGSSFFGAFFVFVPT